MTGCATTKKSDVVLPPKPERVEIQEIKTTADFASVLNYYETLVQKWELWGETVENIIYEENPPRLGQ